MCENIIPKSISLYVTKRFIFEMTERGGKMAQWVEVLAAKANDLSLSLEPTWWKEKLIHASYPLTSIYMSWPPHTDTNILFF